MVSGRLGDRLAHQPDEDEVGVTEARRTVDLPEWARKRSAAWLTLWNARGLDSSIAIEWSSRMTRSLGRCYPERRVIRLAASLIDGPQNVLEETLCHELAHIVAFEHNGKNGRPHGPEWKALMRKAGFAPRARLRWDGAPPTKRRKRRRRYIYIHLCPVCHAKRNARRAVRQWRCAACIEAGLDGELEIQRRQARFYETR
jgi:predicted SprT family Zn-dependent metalloprotease